jgi:hypothetical protein
VGVSAIAFTSDGFLVTVVQSELNQASARLLAPSGSGSLEMDDVTSGEGDLAQTVKFGMEREMCEEVGLERTEIVSTKVVGFARWMERGAKPEFFGLTEVQLTSGQVRARRVTRQERLYSLPVKLFRVDLVALGRELADGVDIMEAEALPSALHDGGSLPLLAALRAAARWKVSGVALAG